MKNNLIGSVVGALVRTVGSNLFSTSAVNQTSGDITTESSPRRGLDGENTPVVVANDNIFTEKAVNSYLDSIDRQADPDETLRELGVHRSKLRVLLTDDEIFSAIETRRDTLHNVPILVESLPDEESDESASESQYSEWLKRQLNKHKVSIINGASSARPFGYSVMERVYKKEFDDRLNKEMVAINYVVEKPFEWFEPKHNGDLYYYPSDGVMYLWGRQNTLNGSVLVDTTYKFLLTRSNPTYRNPYGDALLSRLYWCWYFRVHGWKFWAKWLERFSSPLIVGKSSNTAAMLSSLIQAHNQAALSVDKSDDVNLLSAPSSNSANFEKFEESLIRRIQKTILGSTLTTGTDGGAGNRALGQVHNSVRFDKRNSDIQMIANTFQNVADALCDLNGIPRRTVLFMDQSDINSDRAKRDRELSSTGVKFTKTYFKRTYGLKDDEFEVSDPKAEALPLNKDNRDRTDQQRDPVDNSDPNAVDDNVDESKADSTKK